jgi:hypothetical protein
MYTRRRTAAAREAHPVRDIHRVDAAERAVKMRVAEVSREVLDPVA